MNKENQTNFVFEYNDRQGLKKVSILTPTEKQKQTLELYGNLIPKFEALGRKIQGKR